MMGNYFKPLRRKFGVFAAIVAFGFLIVWLKSLFGQDTLSISTGDRSHHFVYTSPHGLVWEKVNLPPSRDEDRFYQKLDHPIYRPGWFSNHEIDFDPEVPFNFPVDWHWRLLGFHCGSAHDKGWPFLHVWLMAIPYWMLVIPVALLAVWLLRSKCSPPKENRYL